MNLIGMSWGGFFSLRFASENPEKVSCIYLDAPLCNSADRSIPPLAEVSQMLQQEYGLTEAEMQTSFYNPVNALKPIVGIPVFAAVGEDDLAVPPANHINILENRFKALGGNIKVCRRAMWGHHPHGFDDRAELLSFIIENAEKNSVKPF